MDFYKRNNGTSSNVTDLPIEKSQSPPKRDDKVKTYLLDRKDKQIDNNFLFLNIQFV